MSNKPIIRFAFTDIPDLPDRHPPGYRRPVSGPGRLVVPIGSQNSEHQLLQWLAPDFDLEHSPENPDYLFYSTFGYNFLEFPDAVRIFFTTENVRPDFNVCDYAFGFDHLQFGDRYTRFPNYYLYQHFDDLLQRRRSPDTLDFKSKKFCNFLYTNQTGHPLRDEVFHALNHYQRVDSPGRHLNNMLQPVGRAYHGDWASEKVDFQRGYRFSIAFENSSTPGYCTEKIVHALAADTIPIYWGDPTVGTQFNNRRIINCHDLDSVEAIVARVREVNEDETLYREMMQEPFFPRDSDQPDQERIQTINQLGQIFRRPKAQAFRRNSYFWGQKYEERLRLMHMACTFLHSTHWSGRCARLLAKLIRR